MLEINKKPSDESTQQAAAPGSEAPQPAEELAEETQAAAAETTEVEEPGTEGEIEA